MVNLPAPLVFGTVMVRQIIEATIPMFSPSELLPDCTPEILEQEAPSLPPHSYDSESNLLVLTTQSYLVQSQGKNILVDACIGNDKARKRPTFDHLETGWMERLLATGVTPADVDIVVCTHLHVDHVGWCSMLKEGRWVPTFPRARYLLVKPELDFFTRPEVSAVFERNGNYWIDSIQPVIDAGQVDCVSEDYRIDDNISLIHSPGDTPGNVAVLIRTEGRERAIVCGDIFHHILQCKYPRWNSRFSQLQDMARQTRMALFERYADTDVCILSGHLPTPGYLVRKGISYDFCPVKESFRMHAQRES
jgi:glyoxylase-like metal-dependent hydrolase (beta-lactamase superfamily II)